ncbi:MAG: YihY/virulence factor BrkB family protein [Luteolibacter sp.]|uniref:YihY/virulence factor BrkB family protein n=1 Tax=Luteolibacter sp. TaxID=1962973 RepID=UPI003267BF31
MEKRPPKIIRFASRVLRDFFLRNHGMLLTAAVANNMMLSLIPLSAVLVVLFSHFIDPAQLMESISIEVSLIAPGFAPTLNEVLTGFLQTRQLIGWLGLGSLVIFSSFAFRVLEDAFAIIFHQPLPTLKRKFWVSALMPYFFILIVAAGLIAITTINAVIDARSFKNSMFSGVDVLLQRHLSQIIYTTGVLGLVLLFTLFYKIMPVAKIPLKRALIAGLTTTILWEIVRHVLVAYYTKVSSVNVIYGSMATIIIVLLIMEAIALIILLGAQIIADLQRSADAGLAWHEDPETLPEPVTQRPI